MTRGRPAETAQVGAQSRRAQTLTQGDEVAGMAFDPAGKFQLEEEGGHRGG